MITSKIGIGGWIIVTSEDSLTLVAAYENTSASRLETLIFLRDNVFIDNEGETFVSNRVYVNTTQLFVDGSTNSQANLAANLAHADTLQVTEALWVKADNSTLEYSAGKLRIKDGGVGQGKINASALESGLELVGGTKVGVKVSPGTNTLEHNGGGIRVKAQGIDSNELKVLSVRATHLNADTKGSGMVAGGGTAMAVSVAGTTVTVTGGNLEVTPASINGSKIVPNSLGINEVASHMKNFSFDIDLDCVDQGANNDISINRNFRILGITGIVKETVANSGGHNFTINMIANGSSEITHSIADGTAQDTAITFGAFATTPLELTNADYAGTYNVLQFVLGQAGAAMTAGKVKLSIHCLLLQ